MLKNRLLIILLVMTNHLFSSEEKSCSENSYTDETCSEISDSDIFCVEQSCAATTISDAGTSTNEISYADIEKLRETNYDKFLQIMTDRLHAVIKHDNKILKNQVCFVLKFKKRASDLLFIDDNGNTFAHLAVQAGNLNLLRSLFENDYNIDTPNALGQTPLFTAIDPDIISYLIENGAHWNHQDNNGATILDKLFFDKKKMDTKLKKLKTEIKNLKENNSSDICLISAEIDEIKNTIKKINKNIKESENRTKALQFFIDEKMKSSEFPCPKLHPHQTDEYLNHEKMMLILHNQKLQEGFLLGSNIDVTDESHNTLLHYAAKLGSIATGAILIDKKINMHAQNKQGQTALHVASFYNKADFINMLTFSVRLAFDESKYYNFLEMKDIDGRTALMTAVKMNNVDAINALINAGANIHQRDNDKNSLLHHVIDPSIAERLIQNGLSVHDKGFNGQTPLHYANAQTAQIFISHGADVHATNDCGSTPLHLAKRENIATILLDAGAHINSQNASGQTPLHFAVILRNTKLQNLLISYGANLEIENKDHFNCRLLKRKTMRCFNDSDDFPTVTKTKVSFSTACNDTIEPTNPIATAPENNVNQSNHILHQTAALFSNITSFFNGIAVVATEETIAVNDSATFEEPSMTTFSNAFFNSTQYVNSINVTPEKDLAESKDDALTENDTSPDTIDTCESASSNSIQAIEQSIPRVISSPVFPLLEDNFAMLKL